MSIYSAVDVARDGWGLEDEDLDRIMRIENLEDVTQRFANRIEMVRKAFGSVSNLRVISFSEDSGVDADSRHLFAELISARRYVFYHPLLSNKGCCVILTYYPEGLDRLESYRHLLRHEYAHHFAWAHAGFPMYICKGHPPVPTASFAEASQVGPEFGSAFIDGSPLRDLHFVIQDSNERISDIVSEGILREKDLTDHYLEYFKDRVVHKHDPAVTTKPDLRRYIRRLVLRDSAELGATLQLAYPEDNNVKKILLQDKRTVVNLNRKYVKASLIYEKIFNLSLDTDFRSFKSPETAVHYTKNIMDLLNISIRTSEKW